MLSGPAQTERIRSVLSGPAHDDKERRLSPLNEPVDFLNLAMIFPLDLRYGFP